MSTNLTNPQPTEIAAIVIERIGPKGPPGAGSISVPNRLTADHTGWKLGQYVQQTGDRVPRVATVTFAAGFNGYIYFYEQDSEADLDLNIPNTTPEMAAAAFAGLLGRAFVKTTVTGATVTLEQTWLGEPGSWQLPNGDGIVSEVTQEYVAGTIAPGAFLIANPDRLQSAEGYLELGAEAALICTNLGKDIDIANWTIGGGPRARLVRSEELLFAIRPSVIQKINFNGDANLAAETFDLSALPNLRVLQMSNTGLLTAPDSDSVTSVSCDNCAGLTVLPLWPAVTSVNCYNCAGLTVLPLWPAVTSVSCGNCAGLESIDAFLIGLLDPVRNNGYLQAQGSTVDPTGDSQGARDTLQGRGWSFYF